MYRMYGMSWAHGCAGVTMCMDVMLGSKNAPIFFDILTFHGVHFCTPRVGSALPDKSLVAASAQYAYKEVGSRKRMERGFERRFYPKFIWVFFWAFLVSPTPPTVSLRLPHKNKICLK